MKRKNINFVLMFVLFMVSIIGIFSVKGLGASTLTYNFQNDNLFNSTGFGRQSWVDDSSNTFNIRQRENITNNFPATYSFENEIIGANGTDIKFIDSESVISNGGSINITDFMGHNKVINSSFATGYDSYYNNFDFNVIKGTIEFWINLAQNTIQVRVGSLRRDTANTLLLIFTNDGKIKNHDGVSYNQIGSLTYEANRWYHVKIIFNCTSNTYDFYLNGILGDVDISFYFNVDYVDDIYFGSDSSGGSNFKVDGVGYSWDGYNATYSFDDVSDGTQGTTIPFIDYVSTAANTEIFNSENGHYKVLRQTNVGSNDLSYSNVDWGKSGIVEYWSLVSQNDRTCPIYLREDGTILIELSFASDGTITSIDDESYEQLDASYDVNRWYHIKFEWYFNNTFDVYIDNVLVAANFLFRSGATQINGVNRLYFRAYDGTIFFDGIGIVSENYNEGDNLEYYSVGDNTFPEVEIYENQYEVDKWEFRHNPDTRIQYVDGFDDPSGWTDDEITDGKVNTLNIGGNRDIVVHIDDDGGLYRNFGGIIDTYYNISFNFEINQLDDDDVGANAIILKVDDNEGDVIGSVYIRYDNTVDVYHDGTGTELGSITRVGNFTATFLINFDSQVFHFILSDWNNGTVFFDFFGGFYSTDATDVRKVSYSHSCTSGDVVDSDIFSISIYNTTGSVSDDVGVLRWDNVGYTPNQSEWDFTEFNLIELEGNFQNFSLFYESFGGVNFKNIMYWNVENKNFVNVYQSYSINTITADLHLWMYDNFTFESISIDGVKLKEGINEYVLNFNYAGVDGNLSYFYENNNRLYFNLNTDDGNLEYIEASFDVNNVLSENRSMSFSSNLNGGGNGYLRLNYTDDTSTFISFPSHATSTSLILPQEKDIDTFVIVITDLDSLSSGSTTGYISNLALVYFPDVSISLSTLSLLAIMIPLIILLIPTFAMYKKFGESAIIPMFILMSIVCFIADLIPSWLLFIMLFGSGALLFVKNKTEVF